VLKCSAASAWWLQATPQKPTRTVASVVHQNSALHGVQMLSPYVSSTLVTEMMCWNNSSICLEEIALLKL
jgi:hypothetical protein